jgi:hypothetical protein
MEKEMPYFRQNDDVHCFQACLKMVLKHFLPKKNFTFMELDRMSCRHGDNRSWVCSAAICLNMMDLKVKLYSIFDYKKFSKRGAEYIKEFYPDNVAKNIISYSDIDSEVKNADAMLSKNIFKLKKLSFSEINKWFMRGKKIILLVNWGMLNNKEFSGHYVLLTDIDDDNVYIHDPDIEKGSPNRKVEKNLFIEAWKHPEGENAFLISR